jgi:hypothetical protein
MLGGVLIGCSNTTKPQNQKPAKVRLVPKAPDDAIVESGIDAEAIPGEPNRNAIFLQWYSNTEDDISSYEIYRRLGENITDSTGTFVKVATVNKSDTTYIDNTVGNDSLFFYYVVAVDEEGAKSDPSAKEYYLLYAPPNLSAPVGQSFGGSFEWFFSYIPQTFYFRLERQIVGSDYQHVILSELNTNANVEPAQSRTLNEVGLTNIPPGSYRWRIEINNGREGCESNWGNFVVN